jgi:hypothetical protein
MVTPCGNAGVIQIRRCQGIAVDHCGGTIGALALNRSGVCNVRGNTKDCSGKPAVHVFSVPDFENKD